MRTPSRIGAACLVLLLTGILAFPLIAIVRAGERFTILPNLEVDASGYDAVALQLVQHPSLDSFSPVFPPGFVGIIALVYVLFGHSLVAAKILLWACLVATTALAAVLAKQVHGTLAAAWTAAFLSASSPALQAYTGTLQYEVLVSALILALILLALCVGRAPSFVAVTSRAFLLGIGIGLALLTRESLIALVPAFAAFVACQVTTALGLKRGACAGLVVLVTAVAPAAAWSAHQSSRAGHAMLLRDNVQGILPFGHNPYANGTWNVGLSGIGEPSGVNFILAEPRRELWLTGRKAMYFWGILRDGWNVPRPSAVWMARASGGLLPLDLILPIARGGWILVALLVACYMLTAEQWRKFWLLPAVVASLMFVHLVTISSHRFAVPILPVAFSLIAGPVAGVIVSLKSVGRIVVVLVLLAIGVGMQTQLWRVSYRLDATELDGVDSENRVEQGSRLVRFSDSRYGRRAAFALYDEYLPRGPLMVRLQIRRGTTSRPGPTPVARVRLFLLDDITNQCETEVTVDQMPVADGWTQFGFSCTLAHDGTSRLIAETFGRVDLSFSDVKLLWMRK